MKQCIERQFMYCVSVHFHVWTRPDQYSSISFKDWSKRLDLSNPSNQFSYYLIAKLFLRVKWRSYENTNLFGLQKIIPEQKRVTRITSAVLIVSFAAQGENEAFAKTQIYLRSVWCQKYCEAANRKADLAKTTKIWEFVCFGWHQFQRLHGKWVPDYDYEFTGIA